MDCCPKCEERFRAIINDPKYKALKRRCERYGFSITITTTKPNDTFTTPKLPKLKRD